jgi:hypothetical protein
MRLYERYAFRTVGIYREHGWLDGRWVDVVVMEKILSSLSKTRAALESGSTVIPDASDQLYLRPRLISTPLTSLLTRAMRTPR